MGPSQFSLLNVLLGEGGTGSGASAHNGFSMWSSSSTHQTPFLVTKSEQEVHNQHFLTTRAT